MVVSERNAITRNNNRNCLQFPTINCNNDVTSIEFIASELVVIVIENIILLYILAVWGVQAYTGQTING